MGGDIYCVSFGAQAGTEEGLKFICLQITAKKITPRSQIPSPVNAKKIWIPSSLQCRGRCSPFRSNRLTDLVKAQASTAAAIERES